jgi:hypothetical protein
MGRIEYKTFQQKVTFILMNGALYFCHKKQSLIFLASDNSIMSDIDSKTLSITEGINIIYKKLNT